MREAIELYLDKTLRAGESIPVVSEASVDFEGFDPGHEAKQYVVEWLKVELSSLQRELAAAS